MKTCQFCSEEIQDDATICKHCGKNQNGRDMNTHVTILGILFISFGCLLCVGGIVINLVVPMAGNISGNDVAMRITSIIGDTIGILLVILSMPSIIGGIGLLKRKYWARILILVLSFISLLSIPFGTALGIYGIWILLKSETAEIFNPKEGAISEVH
tara:strand:- start:69 stop:539 length:471 start_codon:yes stop_codon:yes gene_type:complete